MRGHEAQPVGVPSHARNLQGRAQAFTILTRIRRGWTPWLRLSFFAGRHVRYLTAKLRRLSFIHYARWSIVSLPPVDAPRHWWQRQPRYLLVTSNFNGTWDEYIEVFSEVVPWRIRSIWGSSAGFPGPSPPDRLKEFVHANELVADHYYAAYPHASTTLVSSALALRRGLARFISDLPAEQDSSQFRAAWRDFLTEVHCHL